MTQLLICPGSRIDINIESYYVKGGFCHLIHMTAAHLWRMESSYRKGA